METVMEDEEYNWREVKLHSLIPLVPEPELERESGIRRRGRDIIIAIDHGPNSKHAFDWAVTHLCRLADTLHLVHAVSSLGNEIVYESTQGLMDKLAVEAFSVAMVSIIIYHELGHEKLLFDVAATSQGPTCYSLLLTYSCMCRGFSGNNLSTSEVEVKTVARIVEGDAGKVICKEAERLKPSAVVMGTRGRGLFQSVLQGSVAEYCLHNCKIAPVIIVPGKEAGEVSVI